MELWFLYTALVLNWIYLWVKFEVTTLLTLEVMPRSKTHGKNLQRAKTPKTDGIELWFSHTALFFNVIYLYVKFEITSFYTLEVMPQKSEVKIYKGQ